ncbi:hypothetical protein MKD41_07190 [Lutibacter sp. A64]|uniref:hypothetical protein n=1 Tax=Lutibacter sp. A64 TaxID=2918526 RepID=UPI001F057025|nr:hypothetical protein [Lutibacter sp. A64]UMB55249.1 hypothetical protein MKD41_07190 [Lutibacter sp. A64]
MKKYKIYNILGLLLVTSIFTSCDFETAEQDPSDIVSPYNKPTVTITSDAGTVINEGETVTYTITFDKPIERSVTFTPSIGGTADDHDYSLEAVTLQPYTTSVEMPIEVFEDYEIEGQESLSIQIEILGIAERYLVHPDTVIEPIELQINDYVDTNKLIINFAWGTEDDFDILTYSDTSTYPETLWGNGGATSANPEIDSSIWLDDPAGTYYVTILDWGTGTDWDYTFTLGFPDGSVETITGTFDGTNYPYSSFMGPSDWGSPNAYKILKVENNGSSFVVTKL